MTVAKGFVVPAGGGKHFASPTPGRSFALKLLGRETNESIMLFEETLPAGTRSLFHLHHDSDEVASVLAGEITFQMGDARRRARGRRRSRWRVDVAPDYRCRRPARQTRGSGPF